MTFDCPVLRAALVCPVTYEACNENSHDELNELARDSERFKNGLENFVAAIGSLGRAINAMTGNNAN